MQNQSQLVVEFVPRISPETAFDFFIWYEKTSTKFNYNAY